MKKSKLLISVLALMGTMIVTSCENMPFDLNSYISQQGSETTSSLDSKESDDITTSDFTSDVTSLSNDDNSSSQNSDNISSSETPSSSEDSTPVVPTEFKAKAKYYYNQYYDSLGNDTHVYYTDGNEYIAFDNSKTSLYLGNYNKDTNTFDGPNAENYALSLTNEGYRILINKNEDEGYSDDVVYSLLEDTGVSEKVNSKNYHPYFYLFKKNHIITAKYKVLNNLSNDYNKIYGEDCPTKIKDEIYKPEENITIPSHLFNDDVLTVGGFQSIKSLKSVTIEEGITKIQDFAFEDDNFLNSITFPSSLQSLGSSIFKGCSALNSLTLPDNITTCSNTCFLDSSIQSVTFSSRDCLSFVNVPLSVLANMEINFISIKEYESISDALNHVQHSLNLILDVKPTSIASESNMKTFEVDIDELAEGKTIILPIDNKVLTKSRNLNDASDTEETAYDDEQLFAQLKLNNDLVVKGTIELAALVNSTKQGVQGHISGLYTQLDLNGHKLIIENGGTIACNGKIIDSSENQSGKIEVKNGGTIISDFIVDDFYGGSNCLNRYTENITPFNKYRMSYIEPETIVHYGAKYQGYCVLYASNDHNETIQNIVGEGGIFELESEDAYIVKRVDGKTRNEIISIYGNAHTNAMGISYIGMEAKTNNVLFPIPRHYTINICSGTFTLNTKLKVLPGAVINVMENATIKFNHSYLGPTKIDAQVIVYDTYYDFGDPEGEKHHECGMHNQHAYPYYDENVDPTLKGKPDQPGKLTINGNIELGDVDCIALAGNIHTYKDNIQKLSSFIKENQNRISFHIDSKEGCNKLVQNETNPSQKDNVFTVCFTMSKTALNIIVDDNEEENVIFAKLESLTIYRDDEKDLHIGDTITLKLDVCPLDYFDYSDEKVQWESSASNIAKIKSSTNKDAEIEGVSIGKTIITAKVGDIVSNAFEITVYKDANSVVYDWSSEFANGTLNKDDYAYTVDGNPTIIKDWEKTLTGEEDQEINGLSFIGKKEKDASTNALGFVFFGDVANRAGDGTEKLSGSMTLLTKDNIKKIIFKVLPSNTATKVELIYRDDNKDCYIIQDKENSNWNGTLSSAFDITIDLNRPAALNQLYIPYEEGNEFAIIGMTLAW